MEWVVGVALPPLYPGDRDPVPIVREAECVLREKPDAVPFYPPQTLGLNRVLRDERLETNHLNHHTTLPAR